MTTLDEADKKLRVERARETGLFRYSLVRELAEPGLSQAERGWRARELAGRVHEGQVVAPADAGISGLGIEVAVGIQEGLPFEGALRQTSPRCMCPPGARRRADAALAAAGRDAALSPGRA